MRPTLTALAILGLCLPVAALAQATHPAPAKPQAAKPVTAAGGTPIGTFDQWIAATYQDSGKTMCYALTKAVSSSPALPGRGPVVMTVTAQEPGRETVAIKSGYAYPAKATVTMRVEKATLNFYTYQRSAFAHDGHAAVVTFGKGTQAVARGPGPKGPAMVTDTFSLKGFDAALAAIQKACSGK
jgi:hypothetical protein